MEIKSIQIDGFRGVDSVTITPAKLTFITGPSGAGKSSIMDAVRFAITGKPPKAACVNTSVGSATVTAEIEKVGIVSRTVSNSSPTKVRVNGKTTTAKSVMEVIESVFGIKLADMDLLTSSEVMRQALGKELAEYLLNGGFLTNDITFSRLLTLNPMAADVVDELRGLLPADPTPITLADIENAYQHCRSSRPTLKNQLAAERVKAKYDGVIPTRPAKEIRRELDDVLTKIAAEKQAINGYTKAKAEAANVKARLADIEEKLKKYDGVIPVTKRERTALESVKTKTKQLIDETQASLQSVNADIQMLEHTLAELDTSACPISRGLVCTTDKTIIRNELEDSLTSKRAYRDTLKKRLSEHRHELEKATADFEGLLRQEKDYDMKVSLLSQQDALRSATVLIPQEPDPSNLSALSSQQVKLSEEYDCAVKYEVALSHDAQANAWDNKLRIAETLTKELAPTGGVRQKILAHSISPLETWCNSLMAIALPKYTLRFDPDDNFAITVADATGSIIPFDGLSNGEQLRVVTVIMALVNELNGVRVLLLDDLNVLDAETFKAYIKMLESISGSFDQVFLSAIDNPGFAEAVDASSLPHKIIRR